MNDVRQKLMAHNAILHKLGVQDITGYVSPK